MKHSGFTLIEQLAVIAIIAIAITSATPSMATLIERITYDKTNNAWHSFLNQGRASAATYQSSTIACPFDFINNKCSENLSGDWLLFTDDNGNKILDADELSIQTMSASKNTTYWFYPNDRKYIRFYDQPTGLYSGLMASVTICPHGKPDKTAVHLKLNIMGRVASSKQRDAEGVILREVGIKSVKTYPIQC